MRWGGMFIYAAPLLLIIGAWLMSACLVADKLLKCKEDLTVLSRTLGGCAYLIGPITLLSAYEIIANSANILDTLLAHAIFVYLLVAVYGVPIVALFCYLRKGSVAILMAVTAILVMIHMIVIFQFSDRLTISWFGRSLLYWLPYSLVMALTFGIGASLPFFKDSDSKRESGFGSN
jgi:hypothetical protein